MKKLKERAKQLKTDIPAVFLALKRKETPVIAKIIAAVAVAYALSPIDLIPDFIPVIGLIDQFLNFPCNPFRYFISNMKPSKLSHLPS